jgi:hypothetical protein
MTSITPSNINTDNLLLNGAFKYWYSGTSSAPDGWTLSGNGSVEQETTEVPDNFSYAVKITSDSDGNWLRNSNASESSWYSQFENKTVTFSVWVHADDASTARLHIWQSSDSSNGVFSDYHTGGGDWELLTVSYTFPSGTNPSNAIFRIRNEGNTKIIYATGAMLVEGSIPFAYTEHKQDHLYEQDTYAINFFNIINTDSNDVYNGKTDYANRYAYPNNVSGRMSFPINLLVSFGSYDVIIDEINLYLNTQDNATYFDNVSILETDGDGTVNLLINHTDDIGNGSSGDVNHNIVDTPVTLDGSKSLLMSMTNAGATNNTDHRFYHAIIKYHIDPSS